MVKEIFKTITNDDIYNKLEEMHCTQDKILEQARLTNGRITRLETVGLGMWIRNNPFKFAVGVVLFIMIFISDIRHPMIDLIKTLFL